MKRRKNGLTPGHRLVTSHKLREISTNMVGVAADHKDFKCSKLHIITKKKRKRGHLLGNCQVNKSVLQV